MRIAALDIEALPVRLAHDPDHGQIDHDPGDRHQCHQGALHRRRRDQTLDRFVHEPGRKQQEGKAIRLCAQDFHAFETEGVAAVRGPRSHPDREQRQRDRTHVGQHVARIGNQRQRSRHDADHHFGHHEGQQQRQRERQPALVGIAADAVTMAVMATAIVAVIVGMVVRVHGFRMADRGSMLRIAAPVTQSRRPLAPMPARVR